MRLSAWLMAAMMIASASAQDFGTDVQAHREIERLNSDLETARSQVKDGVSAATACTPVLGRAQGLEAFRNDDLNRLGAQARQECEVTLPLAELRQRLAAINPDQEAASAGAGCRRIETTLTALDTNRLRAASGWLDVEAQLNSLCPSVADKLASRAEG